MKKPCLYPACRNLIDRGRYCPDHASRERDHQRNSDKARRMDPITDQNARFRWSKEWQATRRQKLIDNPLCEDPHGRHGTRTATATQVHHIKPLATHYHLRLTPSNLMSVCASCHDVFNRKERSDNDYT